MSSPFSVLLVDDDVNTQHMFEMILAHYGIHLDIAGDQGAALAALSDHVPSVIVLDIFLPGTDGYQLLRSIRSDEHTSHCPGHRHHRLLHHRHSG